VATGVSGWRTTRRRVARWLVDAEALQPASLSPHPAWVVRSPFPLVAVVGIRRPFLVVSQAVIDACSDAELAAILAHEATHVNRRDNLKRLLMLGAPDLLAGTAAARSMELDWQRASEEVADDGAGANNSLHLAAALVKVARLAEGPAAPPATLAAFCRGGDITRRVSRLTAARRASAAVRPRSMLFAGAALAAIVTLALAASAWQHIHALTEVAVNLLQ
jgi:Zn-dependent protease with chaperone function